MIMDEKYEVNSYGRAMTEEEIESGWHRQYVGGAWDEIGSLQFEYLKSRGLRPEHYLLDVGCGALRGGIHFARYLETGHYCGIDINASLIEAGRRELNDADLAHKRPQLAVSRDFDFSPFARLFDFALAQSVFTHLTFNHIIRCLLEIRKVLKPEGIFFATFFEAPAPGHLWEISHPGGAVSHYDQDAYHQSWEEIQWMAGVACLQVERIGDWQHPRNQRMLAFRL
jgi:SAM-dependent methyltransferase